MTSYRVRATFVFTVFLGAAFAAAGVAHAADSPGTESTNAGTTEVSITSSHEVVATGTSDNINATLNSDAQIQVTSEQKAQSSVGTSDDSQTPTSGQSDPKLSSDHPATNAPQGPSVGSNVPATGLGGSGSGTPPSQYTSNYKPLNFTNSASQPTLSTSVPPAALSQSGTNRPTPAPGPSGALGQLSALLGAAVLPLSFGLRHIASLAQLNSNFLAQPLLLLILIGLTLASAYVSRLRRAGFSHAPRSDMPAQFPISFSVQTVSFCNEPSSYRELTFWWSKQLIAQPYKGKGEMYA